MGEKDELRMRAKELRRYHVVQKVLSEEMTQQAASDLLGISERQTRRIVRRVRREGEGGVVHRGRGRPSNRRYAESLKRRVVRLYRGRYRGFGPTLANEKLREREGIEISTQTLREWLLAAGEWERVRRRRRHCQWRQRKSRWGEMIQVDGSHHAWFEDRGSACVLMAYIDDATNRVYARFYEYEGTLPANGQLPALHAALWATAEPLSGPSQYVQIWCGRRWEERLEGRTPPRVSSSGPCGIWG